MVDEKTSADLGALGVEHDSAGLVRALLEGLSEVRDRFSVSLQKESAGGKAWGNLQRDHRGRS